MIFHWIFTHVDRELSFMAIILAVVAVYRCSASFSHNRGKGSNGDSSGTHYLWRFNVRVLQGVSIHRISSR
jgi:hypothetical protein